MVKVSWQAKDSASSYWFKVVNLRCSNVLADEKTKAS